MILTAQLAEQLWNEHDTQSPNKHVPSRKILLVSSCAGISGLPLMNLYASSKHAVIGYWLSVCAGLRRQELDRNKASFTCDVICPFFSGGSQILSIGWDRKNYI